jgi:hypothetical protein
MEMMKLRGAREIEDNSMCIIDINCQSHFPRSKTELTGRGPLITVAGSFVDKLITIDIVKQSDNNQ